MFLVLVTSYHRYLKFPTLDVFQYEFWIEEGRQEYRMDCMLCGFGEDSISIAPFDPRQAFMQIVQIRQFTCKICLKSK